MAAPVGRTDPTLAETLLERPWDFDFFQAVRLVALIFPHRRVISGFRQPPDETVRFHAHLTMLFPPSSIQDLAQPPDGTGPLDMTVNFMGLTGPQGVLPSHYTEYLIARSYSRDSAAAAFFDIFNHRLISLFYLAWEKHHFPIAWQRESPSSSTPGRFTQYLFDLVGMGTGGLRGRVEFPDTALIHYSGLIAQRPHSASALAGMLRDYFQAPVEVDQFIGKWCGLDDGDLCYLGAGGVSTQLGYGAVAGDQVWNQQARFRIRVGPLNWERFNSFLPGGSALRELIAASRYFVNQALDFDLQLVLLAAEVPWCCVSDEPGSPRLGLTTWLKTDTFQEDARDLVMTVRAS